MIEFDLNLFPTVHRIFKELRVGLTPVPGTTTPSSWISSAMRAGSCTAAWYTAAE